MGGFWRGGGSEEVKEVWEVWEVNEKRWRGCDGIIGRGLLRMTARIFCGFT